MKFINKILQYFDRYKHLIKNINVLSRLFEPTDENVRICIQYLKKYVS